MQIEVDERTYQQLEAIARAQGRDVQQIAQEAVEQYLARQIEAHDFDALIDEIMEEQAWVLNELDKR
jgi:predicted transcriptional regulator